MRKELYYTKVGTFEQKYTEDSSSGRISVEQIVKGKQDIFIKNSPEENLKKKKIVVRDWLLSAIVLPNYSSDLNKKKFKLYTELLNNGFEIYGYIDGHLKKILNANELKNVKLRSENEALEDAGKFGFTKDETYIAGPMESLKLLNLQEFEIEAPLLRALSSSINKQFFKELSNKKSIKIKCMIDSLDLEQELANETQQLGQHIDHLDFHSISSIDNINKIFNNCPNITLLKFKKEFLKIDSIILSDLELPPSITHLDLPRTTITFKDVEQLIEKCPNLTSLDIGCCNKLGKIGSFRLPPSITKLNLFGTDLNFKDVEQLTENCHNLITLNLDCCSNLGNAENVKLPSTITKLSLYATKLTIEDLKNLIANFPNLAKLDLREYKNLEEIGSINLPSTLTELNLYKSDVTFKSLEQIVEYCPNLTTINLGFCNNLGKIGNLKFSSSMTTITLNGTEINFKDLEQLIENCSNLISLSMRNCNKLEAIGNLKLPSSMTTLDLTETPVTFQDLAQLIENCSNLTKLYLSSCRKLGEVRNFQLPSSITELYLTNAAVTFVGLEQLIKNCSNLNILYLNDCRNLGEVKNFKLPISINYLNLSNTNITTKILKQLIENCLNLTTLDLEYCKELGKIENLTLPSSITTLVLSSTNITFKDLKLLIKNCPNLTTLDLGNCYKLGIVGDLKLPFFITQIKLSHTDISFKDLRQLIENCPNLAKLDLSYCKKLGGIGGLNFSPTLTELDLSGTTITFKDLRQLIENCPNLTKLELSCCEKLGNIGNLKLPSSITTLELNGTAITLKDLKQLIENCPNLTKLDLNDCSKLEGLGGLELPAFISDLKLPSLRSRINLEDLKRILASSSKVTGSHTNINAEITNDDISSSNLEPLNLIKNVDSQIIDDIVYDYNLLSIQVELFKPKTNKSFNINPNKYRLQVYSIFDKDTFIFNKSTNTKSDSEINYKTLLKENLINEYDANYENSEDVFLGEIVVEAHSERVALPSLTMGDKLIGIECTPSVDYKVEYCNDDNLYYFTPSNAHSNISIKFLIKTNNHSNQLAAPFSSRDTQLSSLSPARSSEYEMVLNKLNFDKNGKLNDTRLYSINNQDKIRLLTNYFSAFQTKELSKSPSDEKELLNLIMEEQAGHCRHRAMGFMAAALELGIKARMVYSSSHAWVEVYENCKWDSIDLGGSRAETQEISFEQCKASLKTLPEQIIEQHTVDIENNPFISQDKKELKICDIKHYAEFILQKGNELESARKNILCIMQEEQIEKFYLEILRQRKDSYFISDLDEISMFEVVIDQNKYKLETNRLGNFLQNEKGILLVDWSRSRPQHVGLNSMMDAERNLLNHPLSKEIIIINIIKDGIEIGEDFYSRNNYISKMPEGIDNIQTIEDIQPKNEQENLEIKFYGDDWKQVVYGKIILNLNGYSYEESEFVQAIKSGQCNFTLRNAPWNDREFSLAITNIKERSVIEVNGHEYKCEGLNISRKSEEYQITGIKIVEYSKIEEYEVVNSNNFTNLFEKYHVQDGKLEIRKNIFDKPLLITGNLSNGEWARLSDCNARVVLCNNIKIDSTMGKIKNLGNNHSKIIITNDLGLYRENYKNVKIIDVSQETKASDLLEKINYESTIFSHQVGVVTEGLLNDQEIMLIGDPSKELLQTLQSLFINNPYLIVNGERKTISGKVTLVCQKDKGLELFQKERENFSAQEIWDALEKNSYSLKNIKKLKNICNEINLIIPQLGQFNYTQLSSILHRMKEKPLSNPIKHIIRLKNNYHELKIPIEEIWGKHERQSNSREEKILAELELNPYVFIVGPSGVGKSRFIQKELSSKYEIFEGMENLAEIVKEPKDGKSRLLFIDEANIVSSGTIYNVFNGLFEPSRKILVNGKLVKVPEESKIIFAGNYGYFKGRKPIRLVEEHGSIITFKELSKDELYKSVMRPILNHTLELDSEHIMDIFYQTYRKINQEFTENHPLTARNLQMMCFRCKSLYDLGIKDCKLLAALAIYDETNAIFNTKDERNKFITSLESDLKIEEGSVKKKKRELNKSIENSNKDIPKSRTNLVRLIDNLLKTRKLKIENEALSNCGINGLLIEGPSGIGKSYIAKHYLESQGFVRGDLEEENTQKKYYLITPTDYTKIKETLEKAFKEGAIVIIDEINTMLLEPILNPLLSGNLAGKEAKNKGFTVIGTQNPPGSFSNRITFSSALMNRFQKVNLKDYKTPELEQIVAKKFIDNKDEAQAIVKQFRQAQAHDNPKLTPRDLFSYVERLNQERKQQKIRER